MRQWKKNSYNIIEIFIWYRLIPFLNLWNSNYVYNIIYACIYVYRRFNAIVSQLKMHYFSEGAFESLIASQLLKKEKYIWSY